MITREEVYKVIDGERDYQKFWDEKRTDEQSDLPMDKDKSVETWILWMQQYLNKAAQEATKSLDKIDALHNIRKVVAMGVACMEYKGAPTREDEKTKTSFKIDSDSNLTMKGELQADVIKARVIEVEEDVIIKNPKSHKLGPKR